ncbi:MAG: Sec-independent protein translocase subunit TatA [Acidiferrobacter sp.]
MDLFSIWHLLIILAVVLVLFGTSKVRNIGSDLGGAIKSFRSAMKEESAGDKAEEAAPTPSSGDDRGRIIEGQVNPVGGSKAADATRVRKG